jgi:transposase
VTLRRQSATYVVGAATRLHRHHACWQLRHECDHRLATHAPSDHDAACLVEPHHTAARLAKIDPEHLDGHLLLLHCARIASFWRIAAAVQGRAIHKGGRDRCLGRSRGGLTTKIHALVDGQGRPIKRQLTAGEKSDIASAEGLIADLPEGAMLLADKGYDANALRQAVRNKKAWANIPPKANRRDPVCFSKHHYKARNLVERFFNRIKQFRRIATRYDKLAENFLAAVKLASIRIWLRDL